MTNYRSPLVWLLLLFVSRCTGELSFFKEDLENNCESSNSVKRGSLESLQRSLSDQWDQVSAVSSQLREAIDKISEMKLDAQMQVAAPIPLVSLDEALSKTSSALDLKIQERNDQHDVAEVVKVFQQLNDELTEKNNRLTSEINAFQEKRQALSNLVHEILLEEKSWNRTLENCFAECQRKINFVNDAESQLIEANSKALTLLSKLEEMLQTIEFVEGKRGSVKTNIIVLGSMLFLALVGCFLLYQKNGQLQRRLRSLS